jgi:hypothetical protein
MSWTRFPTLTAAIAIALTMFVTVSCAPISKGYEIHTGEIGCEEANRLVHDALLGMRMTVTGFKVAKPGSPGYVSGSRVDNRGRMDGTVKVRCDPEAVHITANQSGIGGDEFEIGVFLSVTGRAGLEVEREGRNDAGKLVKRSIPTESGSGATESSTMSGSRPPAATGSSRARARSEEKVVGVRVLLEPIEGYATLLDFDANLSAAGILPVRVQVDNGTGRSYEFDPQDVVLRRAGSRDRAKPLSGAQAVSILKQANLAALGASGAQPTAARGPGDPLAPSELGDVRRAAEVIPQRALRGGLLRPGDRIEGFLYYRAAEYDRARILMIDSATGETEGFLVEF